MRLPWLIECRSAECLSRTMWLVDVVMPLRMFYQPQRLMIELLELVK